jgi:peptidyl-prolyl cis-trans isomerase D
MVLQSIRERLTGLLAIFILGILVIPFAFVGVNSYFQSGTENLVARVNDQEISTSDFTQSFGNYRRRMQSIMGASFDPEEFESLVSRRAHLDVMIDEELLSQAASGLDLDIDDERLGEQIRSIPAFQLDGHSHA